jgi:hypothetical protein
VPEPADHAQQARDLLARIRPGDDGPLTLAMAATASALLAVNDTLTAIRAEAASTARAAQKAEPAW